jgi:hypothetical protein
MIFPLISFASTLRTSHLSPDVTRDAEMLLDGPQVPSNGILTATPPVS